MKKRGLECLEFKRIPMADNEVAPEKLDKPLYTEKKCEREFRKLLETTDSPSPKKDSGYSTDVSNETIPTEKKCEREFRKLLETTNSINTFSRPSPNKPDESPYLEKKCEREFRKLLESSDMKHVDFSSEDSNDTYDEIPYIVEKCEKKLQNLFEVDVDYGDNDNGHDAYCNDDAEDDAYEAGDDAYYNEVEDEAHYKYADNDVTYNDDEYCNNENARPEKKMKDSDVIEQSISDDSSCSSSVACISHFQKAKALVCGESSGNIKAINKLILSPSKDTLADLSSLYERLEQRTSLQTKCQSIITLSSYCTKDLTAEELCGALGAIDILSNAPVSDSLSFCQGILLFTLTKQNLNNEQITYIENVVLKLANAVIRHDKGYGNIIGLRMVLVKGGYYLKAYKLCQKLFAEKNLDIDAIDVLTLCCSSLKNLSDCEAGENYTYKDSTIKFILGMTGKATQDIVAQNLIASNDDDYTFVSAPSHMVNQCLQILGHMLTMIDASLDEMPIIKTLLDHEDFSLLHCLNRLLGWNMSYLFQKEQPENHVLNIQHSSLVSYHLSTLVSILKILTLISVNPSQYDSFTNLSCLMEKVMICILKAYFQAEENRFDVLVLALELMINFRIKNRRTFVHLCLKKFQINDCEQVLSIEALLKILSSSIEKINEIKRKPLVVEEEQNTNTEDSEDNEENRVPPDNIALVLEASEEDMELSTIVSFISILIVFFMDTKSSFVDFIRERLSREISTEALNICKKVLQFASLTGGMPVQSIHLMTHTIKKLSRLYPNNPSNEVALTETL
ncbi:hypothetical protein JTE90_010662 [Oedothorax gibbosus]|uniref:Uncharacterized protein n=1 Tax=Oedothorax gibbosus TaxID=931172 RepID=A0AAV6USE7_9ARAC|nr:hypothetical protein JTE90_010662 [Oedothorax gibbosus]